MHLSEDVVNGKILGQLGLKVVLVFGDLGVSVRFQPDTTAGLLHDDSLLHETAEPMRLVLLKVGFSILAKHSEFAVTLSAQTHVAQPIFFGNPCVESSGKLFGRLTGALCQQSMVIFDGVAPVGHVGDAVVGKRHGGLFVVHNVLALAEQGFAQL